MSITKYQIFLKTAACGSFSKAAEAMNFTQSGISHAINSLEEEADRLYIASMHSLHSEEKDVLAVIAWRAIYSYLEKCADACEHAADVVESVVMKNS